MIQIPLQPDLAAYEFTVNLDTVDFDLRIIYNERDSLYYLDIYDSATPEDTDGSRVPVIGGIPIVVDTPLLQDVPGFARPAGDFIALDTSGKSIEAGLGELGARVLLFYAEKLVEPELIK